ncbi:MAG TPA: MAPEG family protein [Gammaproteobacteria bacterium]|nr:MAPEG family protein [Gammaproteobacteria bacterium]
MQSNSAIALSLIIGWTLFLLLLMEGMRIRYLLAGTVASNQLKPDNSNLSPFLQRLSRAHANCYECFPIIGGLLIVALLTNRAAVTDGLAFWLLGARVVQSTIHMISTSVMAANLRFMAFAVQMVIAIYWFWVLLVH